MLEEASSREAPAKIEILSFVFCSRSLSENVADGRKNQPAFVRIIKTFFCWENTWESFPACCCYHRLRLMEN